MWNLNVPELCNETRLKILSFNKTVIQAEILTGFIISQIVSIPKILMITNEYFNEYNLLQIPIKICFAISMKYKDKRRNLWELISHIAAYLMANLMLLAPMYTQKKKKNVCIFAPD